jgi:hypothetical protein
LTDSYPILSTYYSSLLTYPHPYIEEQDQATKTMPFTIRAVASLLYYFAYLTNDIANLNYTKSGTLPKNEVWSGSHTLTGDVTIPSGITLNIEPGSSILIPAGKRITVYGTLRAQGLEGNRISFNKSATNSWYGIIFEDSSVDDDCIVNYCNISNATYGVKCNTASPQIKNCQISVTQYGINVFNSSAFIYHNHLDRCEDTAIWLNQSNSIVQNNDIYQDFASSPSARGFYIKQGYNSEYPTLAADTIRRCHGDAIRLYFSSPSLHDNIINENSGTGIYCDRYSNPDLSYDVCNVINSGSSYGMYIHSLALPLLIGGHNCFAYNANRHIYSASSSQINAVCNWWGGAPPDPGKIYGNVLYTPYCLDNECEDCGSGLRKALVAETASPADLLGAGYAYETERQYPQAINEYENLIEKYPASDEACLALVRMPRCYNKVGRHSEISSLLNNNAAKNKRLQSGILANYMNAGDYLQKGMAVEAIAILENITNNELVTSNKTALQGLCVFR